MEDVSKNGRKTRRNGELVRLVEDLLKQASAPASAYDLARLAGEREERLYPAQVYRALAELVRQGRVRWIEALNAYCPTLSTPGAIVFVCNDCSRAFQHDHPEIDTALHLALENHGLRLDRLIVEATGKCNECRQQTGDTRS